jgi:undecaprenyl-diphosphatase
VNAPRERFSNAAPVGEGVSARASVQRIAGNLAQNVALCIAAVLRPAHSIRLPQSSGTMAWSVVLIAAATASMFFFDSAALDWARREPHWFRAAFERITDLGLSGWFLFPCGFVLLVLAAVTAPPLTRIAQGVLAALAGRFGFLFLAVALPGLFVSIAKRLIGRARPYVGGHEDPFHYEPFMWRPEFASMPSGHATTAVAAAIAIGAMWPRTRVVMWFYAGTIMVSRVAVLAHHPSDVIGGALVAVLGVHLLRRWFAARGWVFLAKDLRAKAGPRLPRIKAALRQAMSGRA